MSNRDEVLRLLGENPARGRNRYVPATDETVEALERRYMLNVPDDLREWLGLYIQQDDLRLYGLPANKPREGITRILDIYRVEWPNGWLPIAGDGCGCYYILDLNQRIGPSHPIFFWDHETDWDRLDYIVASGLWPFLRFFLLDEINEIEAGDVEPDGPQYDFYWPFDRDRVLAEDPALVDYEGPVPFPWDEE